MLLCGVTWNIVHAAFTEVLLRKLWVIRMPRVRVVLMTLQVKAPVMHVGHFMGIEALTCRHVPCLRFHAECMHAVVWSMLVQTLCRYPVRLPITCCAVAAVLVSSL